MSKYYKIFTVGTVFLHVLFVDSCVAWASDNTALQEDLKFETSQIMKSTVYRDKPWGANDTASDGAFSSVNKTWDQTHTGKWFIEQQRAGDQIISTGLAYGDRVLIDRGLKILEWGFAQQKPDGSFSCDDAFHSTSFFVEAAAHSILLLKTAPKGAEFKTRVDDLQRKLALTAHWMINPEIEKDAKSKNLVFTHRRYLVGAALGEAAIALNDQKLLAKSEEYVRDGLSLQRPDGVNPEKHGYDSNYQAVGMVFALRYYRLVADDAMKAEMYPYLARGMIWLESRITNEGDVLSEGNTRSGGQEKNRDGTPKGINYTWVVISLADWGFITNDAKLYNAAELVWHRWQLVKPGHKG